MSKNVYSLVLMDEIVEAIDKLAYQQCTSRSGLINRILADYLSCPTPESRIRDIFSCMEEMFAGLDSFQFREQPSESMVTIRSALHYRYRPTVRYLVELYRENSEYLGELRVSFRTQNRELLELSEDFFRFWTELESEVAADRFPEGKIPYSVEPGRFIRRLLRPGNENSVTCESLARTILDYIRLFDDSMKKYFADESEAAKNQIAKNYLKRLNRNDVL